MTSITDKLINRIQRKKRGWVFTPKDFLDLGTRAAVDKVLSRLTRARVALLDDVSHHANLMLQALSYFGNGNIDDQLINHCARTLTDKDLAGLHHVMGRIPSWIADTIHKIEQIKHGQIHHST
jgi:hypothetical protein